MAVSKPSLRQVEHPQKGIFMIFLKFTEPNMIGRCLRIDGGRLIVEYIEIYCSYVIPDTLVTLKRLPGRSILSKKIQVAFTTLLDFRWGGLTHPYMLTHVRRAAEVHPSFVKPN